MIQPRGLAVATAPDNNIAATQAANQAYFNANPNTFGAVSIDQLKPETSITVPTATPTTTTADSLVTGTVAGQKSLTDYINSITPPTTALDTQNQAVLDSIANLTGQGTGKNQALAQAKIDQGVPDLNKQLSELNGQITIGNSEYSKMIQDAEAVKASLPTAGITSSTYFGQQAQIDRQNASLRASKAAEIGMLAARAQAVSGNITTALSIAQNAVDAKYGPIEDELKIKQAQLAALKPSLDKEQTILSEALTRQYNDQQKALEEEKANQKSIAEMVMQASAQGAPADLTKAAANAKTPLEATKILGQYSGDYLKYEMLKEQIKTEKAQQLKLSVDTAKTYADIKKIKADIVASNPSINPEQAGKFAGALSVILGSDKFTKEQKAAVTNAINSGQDPLTVIKNQAKNIMGQTLATTLDKYETIKAQQTDLQNLLSDYYSNGGKTGIFKGNFEKTLNNLGQVSDPKLVEIATNIAGSLQAYRNAISGTAYSAQEGKDIASIFPGINKSEGLNTAILKGRLNFIDKTIDASYRNVLGGSYDQIKDAGVVAPVSDNAFSKALGSIPSFVTGSTIISGTTPTGLLNFNIPN